MAIFSGYPATYQPNVYPHQGYNPTYPNPNMMNIPNQQNMQNMQNMPNQPMPQQNSTPQQYYQNPTMVNVVLIESEEEANMFPVVPNGAVLLWNMKGKYFMQKTADAIGSVTMKHLDYSVREEQQEVKETNPQSYATLDEMSSIKDQIKKMSEEISGLYSLKASLTTKIEDLRNEINNLSIVKRQPRKKEAMNDDDE